MKYIERLGRKMIFHLGGLETNEFVEGMKERVPTEEAPYEPLKLQVARGRSWERGATGRTLSREREEEKERTTVQGFKYPWTRAWSDIV
jgi:hypothetical protein